MHSIRVLDRPHPARLSPGPTAAPLSAFTCRIYAKKYGVLEHNADTRTERRESITTCSLTKCPVRMSRLSPKDRIRLCFALNPEIYPVNVSLSVLSLLANICRLNLVVYLVNTLRFRLKSTFLVLFSN